LHWTDTTLDAGLIMGLVGLILTVRQVGRRHWSIHQPARLRSARFVEGVGDLASQAVVFGGLAVIQFGNVAGHISEKTLPANLWQSLIASTIVFVLFGVLVGRMLMRWRLRSLLAAIDAKDARS
jgi:hypothetical protein